ncbi:uncharacterized protein [Diadema antillarum]|uniref:uncharacterized protein n=1 Tax=Diadema antillarum TaxID=105358 RepID=UPI003A89062F
MAVTDLILSSFRRCSLPLVLFLYAAGIGMQFPVSRRLMTRQLCMEVFSRDTCENLADYPKIQARVQGVSASAQNLQGMLTDIPGALAMLVLGTLSDRIGRKRVLLVPCYGSLILAVVSILQSLMTKVSIPLTVLGALVFGLSGGLQTLLMTIINIITDTTPEEKVVLTIGRTLPVMAFGSLCGGLSADILPQFLGPTLVLVIFAISQILSIAIVKLFVEESLPPVEADGSESAAKDGGKGRGRIMTSLSTVWTNLTEGFRVVKSQESSLAFRQLVIFLVASMLSSASTSFENTLVLFYTKLSPFGWSIPTYRVYTTAKMFFGIIGQSLGTPVFLGLLGKASLRNDFRLLQYGALFAAIATMVTALAPSSLYLLFGKT